MSSIFKNLGEYSVIGNTTLAITPGVTQSEFFVRDYHSEFSKSMRRNSWFARLLMFQRIHPEYVGYMYTFTYNNKWLPNFDVTNFRMVRGYNEDCLPCFCRKDVQNFFKKLRKRVKCADPIADVKYLWCSEYGGNNTKRSHYHAVIFLKSVKISSYLFEQMVRDSWTHTTGQFNLDGSPVMDSLGFVYVSKNPYTSDTKIDNPAPLRYATKYVTKDTYYLEDERFKKIPVHRRDEFKPYEPFHLQSTNFGSDWVKYLTDEERTDMLVNGIPYEFMDKKGTLVTKRLPLPQYFVDRYFFQHYYLSAVYVSNSILESQGRGRTVRTHRKRLQPQLWQEYCGYIKQITFKSAELTCLQHPDISAKFSREELYQLYMWRYIRATIVGMVDNPLYEDSMTLRDRYMRDDVPTYTEIEDVVFSQFFARTHYNTRNLMRESGTPTCKKLIQRYGFRPLAALPLGQYLDAKLQSVLSILSVNQENKAKEFANQERENTFAKLNYKHYSISKC